MADERAGEAAPLPFGTVAVVGGGAWGTALAMVAERAGRSVRLWIREPEAARAAADSRRNPFLPGHVIPPAIAITSRLDAVLHGADLALLVIPSQFLRRVAAEVERQLAPGVPVLVCSKGIEAGTGALMTAVVAAEMPGRPHAVLSGPSFADEAAAGQPTAVTIAVPPTAGGIDPLAARLAVTMGTATFRPYVSDDPAGVEVGGAVKNVLAIACGMAAGRGYGSNPRAALIARGLAEMQRLADALGGRRDTVSGLAGVGDLTLTCSSEQSRNFSFGKALGGGLSIEAALAGRTAVVEGWANARSVTELADRLGVDMPICATVKAILDGGLSIEDAIHGLLTRPITAEPWALAAGVQVPHPAG
ncbi:glycerol-3-phosphate dehydrogenase (NAD(P)+) [Stella humosa]|uniref:Glycerol-3-phosphate dehydrogenase [NAD(P)+] n=1 Tax=Stella humosa TaxID=94 RepID=A0A3N1M9R0_9PROT|nr:NAD(P)H-dependent glycerol-3-phosphate dehydrogenase [Stella humosa]ROP99968.1 glycerol-3-phosphate dehydrogenase (NAD(P)+) [Stella humosa]BBK30801.1 glycerol-3-phosphate dehydrogenase [NAD(P)+] [Stella humosa]